VIAELKKLGCPEIKVFIGGVIPRQDYDELYKDGAVGIFGPGSNIIECANRVLDEIEKK